MLQTLGYENLWHALRDIGADGVEAAVDDDLNLTGLFHPQDKYSLATATERDKVLAAANSAGQRITALCMFNKFAVRPDVEIEVCAKTAEAAQAAGITAIRIDVVPRGKQQDRAEFLALAAKTLREIMKRTEATGVRLAIENHGNTTNDPEFLTALFEQVGSDRLGLTLDTANFYWYGHPLSKLYEIYARFAGRAFHSHMKSIAYPPDERERQRPMGWEYAKYAAPIYEGDIDFKRVVALLREAGYQGDLCIENETLRRTEETQRLQVLKREVQLLRKVQRA